MPLDTPSGLWKSEVRPDAVAKYLHLADAIAAGIRSGELRPGERLPSHRELGDMFGVTIATVTKGIAEASRRGLVLTRKGSGTFVCEPGATTEGARQVDLGLNTLPSGLVADLLVESLKRVTARPDGEQLLTYAPYHVDGEIVLASRVWLESSGVTFPGSHSTFPCSGVQQGLIAGIAAIVNPGRPVLCEALTYTGILRACGLRGLSIHGVALDSQGALPQALDQAFSETGAELFVCTPSAHNPTGRTMSEARRREIAKVVRRHGAYLIEDAVNTPLSGGEPGSIASHVPERAILLSGFSKCAAPGLRFALAGVPEQLQGAFHENLVATSWIPPRLHAALAVDLISSGQMDECVSRHRSESLARQRAAAECLGFDASGLLPAYHLWVDLPPHWTVDMIVAAAAAQNVRLTASGHFVCPETATPNGIRICLGAEEDRDVLHQGLGRLGALLRGSQPLTEPVI